MVAPYNPNNHRLWTTEFEEDVPNRKVHRITMIGSLGNVEGKITRCIMDDCTILNTFNYRMSYGGSLLCRYHEHQAKHTFAG